MTATVHTALRSPHVRPNQRNAFWSHGHKDSRQEWWAHWKPVTGSTNMFVRVSMRKMKSMIGLPVVVGTMICQKDFVRLRSGHA